VDRAVRKPLVPVAASLLVAALLSVPSAQAGRADTGTADDAAERARVADLIDAGYFARAEQRIAAHGSTPPAAYDEHTLAFQRERMRRIRLDFSLDTAAAKDAVRRSIPDLRDDEFERWDRQGLLEHLDIDGTRFYFKRAPSNLFRLSDEARARRRADAPLPSDGPFEHLTPYHANVVEAATASGQSSVLPQRVEVTQSLTVKADAVPAGTTLRAWIPYPRAIAGQQEQIQWRGSTPGQARIAPASALQRTAYLEGTAVAGQPTRFEIRYALTVQARHTRIDPAVVRPTPTDPALAPYLAEQPPHVRFTPALRLFSDQVLQGETRPYEVARRLFDAVDRIPWAGAWSTPTTRWATPTCTTGARCTWPRMGGCRWMSPPAGWTARSRRCAISISAGLMPTASPSTTPSASRWSRPSASRARTPWIRSAARSSGTAATCTSINGTTTSSRTSCHWR
jgi:hypothetical protein